MLLLYVLWDDWTFYDFSFKWTPMTGIGIHPTKAWLSQLVNFKNAILIWGHFRIIKNALEKYGMLQTSFGASCMNQASAFEWYKRFKEGSESEREDERGGRSKEVNTPELIGQRVMFLRVFRMIFRQKRPALFKSGQWHFHQDNAPVYNSILVTDYLT